MDKLLQVLIVEDLSDDAEMMVMRLEEEGFHPEWKRVEIEPDYLKALEERPDLILADWALPQFSGLRALELMNERGLNIPFILVSGSIGEEAAINALTSDRPYRKAWSRKEAFDHIKKESGTHFDPQVVELFLDLIKDQWSQPV